MPEFIIRWRKRRCKQNRYYFYTLGESIFRGFLTVLLLSAIPLTVISGLRYDDYTYYSKITDNQTKREYELKCDDANNMTINSEGVSFTYEGIEYNIKDYSIIKETEDYNFGAVKEEHCK